MFNVVTPPTKRAASPSLARATKHPRTSFSPTTVSDVELRRMVKNLSKQQLESVIMQTAQFHPTAKQSIHSLVSSMHGDEAKDFKFELEECLHLINTVPTRLRPFQLLERTSEIRAAIDQAVQDILAGVQGLTRNELGNLEQRWKTWTNGYTALIKITKGVMGCENGELGKSLRNNGVLQALAEGLTELLFDAKAVFAIENLPMWQALREATATLDRTIAAYGIDDFGPVIERLWEVIEEGPRESDDESETEGSDC